MEALTIGANADALNSVAAQHGATVVHQAHHEALTDFGPEAWGEAAAQVISSLSPQVVMGSGTERGHEIVAQIAARLDLPASMNCTEFDSSFDGTQPLKVVRARWGGSLLEQAEVDAPIKLVTLANHTVEPTEAPTTSTTNVVDVQLDASVLHSIVRDRVERVAGVTLATASVVVSGGRGVGSAREQLPITAGATTPIRSGKRAHALHPTSILPVAFREQSNTGSVPWPPKTSWRSISTKKPIL
jgi:electron transfer flavoprotein alpha subunit